MLSNFELGNTMAVQFFFLSTNVTLKERTRLKKFIPTIFKKHGKVLGTLNYIFCSDEYLLAINKNYLKHNYFTDIVTFDLSPKGSAIAGEIYISVDRVKENAQQLGVSSKEELHRVIFHGALHLCGFKDKLPQQRIKMRKAENDCLKNYFTPE